MEAVVKDKDKPVAKKKASKEGPKRYGTLVRVSDEFADALRKASSFEDLSIAEYATKHLLPLVEKQYRDAVVKAARRMEGGPK